MKRVKEPTVPDRDITIPDELSLRLVVEACKRGKYCSYNAMVVFRKVSKYFCYIVDVFGTKERVKLFIAKDCEVRLKYLYRLPHLVKLYGYGGDIVLHECQIIPSLEILCLKNLCYTRDYSSVSNLKVFVHDGFIDSSMATLTSLTKLDLAPSHPTRSMFGMGFLSRLTSLKTLRIDNRIEFSGIESLSQLEELDIDSVNTLNDDQLCSLPSLKKLRIGSNCDVSTGTLCSLTKLSSLDISNFFPRFVITELAKLTFLNELVIPFYYGERYGYEQIECILPKKILNWCDDSCIDYDHY
jgi:hypothetical protein